MPNTPTREEIAQAIRSHVRLIWRGHDHADIDHRSTLEAADAILSKLPSAEEIARERDAAEHALEEVYRLASGWKEPRGDVLQAIKKLAAKTVGPREITLMGSQDAAIRSLRQQLEEARAEIARTNVAIDMIANEREAWKNQATRLKAGSGDDKALIGDLRYAADHSNPDSLMLRAADRLEALAASQPQEQDGVDLAGILAQLRHAYTHLAAERVTKQREFADGLIAPQIRKLEALTRRAGGGGDAPLSRQEGERT